MTTAVLDNYDSFTYNLVHLLRTFSDDKVDVFRNDMIEPAHLLKYDQIVLSPGPGIPSEAGILCDVIRELQSNRKMLGICLGHQAIAEVFGGTIKNMESVKHAVASVIHLEADPIFEGLSRKIAVGRYHSWVVNNNLPNELSVIAKDEEDQIMAIRHIHFPIYGLQFHPESILTPDGAAIIRNWFLLPH